MRQEERLDDQSEALRLAMENTQSQMWTALPGIVTGVDLSAQTVSVQPTIQGSISSSDGSTQSVNMPLLVDVPIVWPRAGGFALTFPIKAGDEVLVVFASRCIDTWWQSGGVGVQAEARMHDLSDGFAILAPTSQPKTMSNVSAANVQLRDETGTTFVEIAPGGIVRITSVAEVNISTPLAKIVAADIKLTGAVAIVGDITHTGSLVTSGGITAAGITAATASVGGIAFTTHKHTGVQTGISTSGGPTN